MNYLKKSIFLLVLLLSFEAHAFEAIGGSITWSCTGTGRFLFQLVLYRDCNGSDLSTVNENIRVWNHATVTDIPVKLSSRVNISPACLSVGTDLPLNCGVGSGGGNGPGAIEKIIYLSDPLDLNGVPPAEGWVFTFETSGRMANISNLQSPSATGMTLVSKMFQVSSVQNQCLDNSPRIQNDPLMVICAGSPYLFMPDYPDEDHDSLQVDWGTIWNDFPAGFYEAGVVPAATTYAPGYQRLSPTPSFTQDINNTPAGLNATYGDVNFTSFNSGAFVMKQLLRSFRNGKLLAEVEHEFTVYVIDCNFNNTAPQVNGPFAGSFTTTVMANTPVNFTITSTDPELLQDGSPQHNLLDASGAFFSTNFSSGTGCEILPCANLNPVPISNGTQGVTADFSWTPTCDHLKNLLGNEYDQVDYTFVFKFQDDVCPVPAVTYARVIVTVKTDITVTPAEVDCIEVLPNGDLNITWTQATDPNGDFVRYELHSVENGLISTFPGIGTTTTTFTPFTANSQYFIKTFSGNPCPIGVSSDTIRPIVLEVISNAGSGVAQLKWNSPYQTVSGHAGTYEVLREYPPGVWTNVGSTAYPATQILDTIDICSAFLNYQIRFDDGGCAHLSTIDGDNFTDEIPPASKPVIASVSIDTATNRPILSWTQANEPDTYGYIIYFGNSSTEVDTAVGIANTSYLYTLTNDVDSVTFSVAAIDSCLIAGKTSPESDRHRTCYLQGEYDLCGKQIDLNWTAYKGWRDVRTYRVFVQINGAAWQLIDSTSALNYSMAVAENQQFRFVIEAVDSVSGNQSFSNSFIVFSKAPSKPGFHYTRTATVEGDDISVKHHIQKISGVTGLQLERLNETTGLFEIAGFLDYAAAIPSFLDTDVDPASKPYTYQVRLIDSCGNPTSVANRVTTIHLSVQADEINLTNHLSWTPYVGFNGSILYYNIYRGIEGVFGTLPEARVKPDQTFFLDTLFSGVRFDGKICYYVEAVESMNIYGFSETSNSNVACSVMQPLIYIPNSFTPDGDGLNEVFFASVNELELQSFEFNIINRWGERIFRTFDQHEGWDGTLGGKDCQDGVYQYVLKVKDGNGQEIIRRGYVTLIR